MQTFSMLLFIAHPNIVQYMLYQFKCLDVDGVQRLQHDLQIQCWTATHSAFTFAVALPSLALWGLGLPLLAFWLLSRKQQDIIADQPQSDTRRAWGFLYGGYKSDFYYWEIVIACRKIVMICLCVFVTGYGVLTQALILLLVLILFLVMTARKRPHISEALFDLEALSLATSITSVYCALFFLANTNSSHVGNVTYSDQDSEITFKLSDSSYNFLTVAVVALNAAYFLYWLYRVLTEMEGFRGLVLRTCPNTVYLALFAFGDRD